MAPVCIVCACPADVYCHNDDAHLCFACDDTVHSAHPVARNHKRTPIGDCAPREESLGDAVAVPQELLDVAKPKRLSDLDLSFSDEGWFTVPDTACSNTRGAVTSNKAKGFSIDDLFGFDAALDEEVAFALDPPSDDLLADCLVPNDEPEPPRQVAPPDVTTFKQEFLEHKADHQSVPPHETTATAVPALPPPPAPAAAPAIAFTYAPVADIGSTVESYIPCSLRPVDATERSIELAERREKVQRFREKKKNRQFKKLIRYASRKRYAEVRPRIKGRFARKDEIAAAKAAGVPLEC